MKISKKSWHYRLIKLFHLGELPKMSLCNYVWNLIFFLLVFIILIPFFLIILGFYIVGTIGDWILKKLPESKPKPPKPPREPKTLLGKWMKAKKEKVCPLLEWEE